MTKTEMTRKRQLELVLRDVVGNLKTLHQEEEAGLTRTSLRVEINAWESIADQLCRIESINP